MTQIHPLPSRTAPPTYTVAHLSDVHLPMPPGPGIRALLNKRLLGYLSWRLRRSKIHRPEVLEALHDDLRRQAPDHIAVTGDIVNISLPSEFEQAAAWFPLLGLPDRVTVIPGNHDAYVAVPWAQSWSLWAPYMASEGPGGEVIAHAGFDDFPLVRRRDPVAIVGLTSALPTRAGLASGKVGVRQATALAERLAELGREGLFRIILIHHPPIAGSTKRRKSLDDYELFHHAVETAGAELVLHGHNHRFEMGDLVGPRGPVPVIGVASASAVTGTHKTPAGQYHLYGIARAGAGWTLEWRTRVFATASGGFVDAGVKTLDYPP